MFGLESSNATMQSEVYVVLAATSVCFLSLGLYPLYQEPRNPQPLVSEAELSRLAAELDASTPTFVFTAKNDGWELGHAHPPNVVKTRIKDHLVPLIKKLSEERNFDVIEIRGHTDGVSHDERASTMDGRRDESTSQLYERITEPPHGFEAASNAELGLQRALQVKAIFEESMTKNELGNIKYIHAFSAGEFIRPDGNPVGDQDRKDDDGRRRVEIRLSRIPACRSRVPQECSEEPGCIWVAESVGCVSRNYSDCFQHESELQCREDEGRCHWLPATSRADVDARAMCVPGEIMDWMTPPSRAAPPPGESTTVDKKPEPKARKSVCVLDGTRRSRGRLERAAMVCRRLEASGWECRARGFLYPKSEKRGMSGYVSHVVFARDRRLWKTLMDDLDGTKFGTKLDSSYNPEKFHGWVSEAEVNWLPECRHANAVLFLGTDFADRSPI